MLPIDLTGKRAFVAGVADDARLRLRHREGPRRGGRHRVPRHLAPRPRHLPDPAPPRQARRVARDARRRASSSSSASCRSTPSTTLMDDVPADVRDEQALQGARRLHPPGRRRAAAADFGAPCLDVVVHSLANGSEVSKRPPRDEPPRATSAPSASAPTRWSSLVQRFGPLVRPGGAFLSLSYMASRARHPRLRRRHVEREGRPRERHARARVGGGPQVGPPRQLHQRGPARVARRERHRSATRRDVPGRDQGQALHRADGRLRRRPTPRCPRRCGPARWATWRRSSCSPLASGVTGSVVHVDKGYHAMGKAVTL